MSEVNTDFVLKNVRISYPKLFTAEAFQNGTGPAKYSASFLLDKTKDAAQIKEIQSAIVALAAVSFKSKRTPPADKLCLRDGDLSGKDDYADAWVLSASEASRPNVVDQKRAPLVEDDNAIQPGYFVNAKVRLWVQDNQWGSRVNADLIGVQLVKEGPLLGSGRVRESAEEMFGEVSDFADDNPFG